MNADTQACTLYRMTSLGPDKPFAPAAERNKAAILEVLRDELVDGDRVLELGSGTGQHLVHFAKALPSVAWQPSDLRPALPGIRQWVDEAGCSNVQPPIELDIAATEWIVDKVDVCYTANTLHIVSWPLVVRLFARCAESLVGNGRLYVYGPFVFNGEHISENNRRFDAILRATDAESGIRDLSALDKLAVGHGFTPAHVTPMPANNHLLLYRLI